MADTKISALPSAGALAGTEPLPIVQGGNTVKTTVQDIANLAGGGGGITKGTANGTDTYTTTISGVASYTDGDSYLIRFTNGNTTAATLNINSLGAKSLYRNNDGAIISGDIWAGGEMLCVYNSTLNAFQCIGTSPNSIFAYITNADSVTITKGQVVYAFGGVGDRMTVKLANNTSDATSARTVGVVLSTSIAANQKGIIILQGLLDGLSILPTSTYADGDSIYLGATAGSITNVKPYAPNHLVYVATVTTASNGSAGRMYVRVQNGYEMDELHDVSAQTPANKNGLFYNTSTSLWEARAVAATDIDANVSNTEFSYLNGVTSAIQTQINAKQDTLVSATNIKTINGNSVLGSGNLTVTASGATLANCADGTPIIGVTTIQYSKGLLIPANSRGANDAPQIEITCLKTGTAGNLTIRMYWNTTNDLAGSPILLGTLGPSATPNVSMARVLMIQVANGTGNATRTTIESASTATGWIAGGSAASTLAIDWTANGYLIGTVQNASALDTSVCVMIKLN